MNSAQLRDHFRSIGARAQFVLFRPSFLRWRLARRYALRISHDHRGAYFLFTVDPRNAPDLRVVRVRPDDREIVLDDGDRRIRCAHDGVTWRITVLTASRPDRPARDVRVNLDRRVADRHRRRAVDAPRQGNLRFVPAPGHRPDPDRVRVHAAFDAPDGSTPVAQSLDAQPGDLTYVSSEVPDGLSPSALRRWRQDHRDLHHVRWTLVRRTPVMFVRGTVTHPEHPTVTLDVWHRVELVSTRAPIGIPADRFTT